MDHLRRAFRDISVGYTSAQILGKPAYVRHTSYADQVDYDMTRQAFYEEGQREGLKTDKEKLEGLVKAGKWSSAKDLELVQAETLIKELAIGKSKNMKFPSMVKGYDQKIKEAEAAHYKLAVEKRQMLGLTCEVYADREVNDHYIAKNLFSDAALTKPLFAPAEFEYMSHDEVSTIMEHYGKAQEACNDSSIKRLAMQGFFQRYFSLVGENLTQFFHRAICDLTFHQVDLLRYGAHFRNIYSSHDISTFPPDVQNDPDLLSDYVKAAEKGKEEMQKQGAYDQDTAVMGVKKEDAKALGLPQNSANPMSFLASLGR